MAQSRLTLKASPANIPQYLQISPTASLPTASEIASWGYIYIYIYIYIQHSQRLRALRQRQSHGEGVRPSSIQENPEARGTTHPSRSSNDRLSPQRQGSQRGSDSSQELDRDYNGSDRSVDRRSSSVRPHFSHEAVRESHSAPGLRAIPDGLLPPHGPTCSIGGIRSHSSVRPGS